MWTRRTKRTRTTARMSNRTRNTTIWKWARRATREPRATARRAKMAMMTKRSTTKWGSCGTRRALQLLTRRASLRAASRPGCCAEDGAAGAETWTPNRRPRLTSAAVAARRTTMRRATSLVQMTRSATSATDRACCARRRSCHRLASLGQWAWDRWLVSMTA